MGRTKYQDFTDYVEYDLIDVVNVRDVVAAFEDVTGYYNSDFLKGFLTLSYPPDVNITPTRLWGWVDLDKGIDFPERYAAQFESKDTKEIVQVKAGRVHKAGALLLSYLMEWAYLKYRSVYANDSEPDRLGAASAKRRFLNYVYGYYRIQEDD
jgi:hypothetical protein